MWRFGETLCSFFLLLFFFRYPPASQPITRVSSDQQRDNSVDIDTKKLSWPSYLLAQLFFWCLTITNIYNQALLPRALLFGCAQCAWMSFALWRTSWSHYWDASLKKKKRWIKVKLWHKNYKLNAEILDFCHRRRQDSCRFFKSLKMH